MPHTSTQAAVKSALYNAIRSSDSISWDVTYGDPIEGSSNLECVYIGAARSENSSQEPKSFRRGHREETYTLSVYCDTSNGTDPQETEEAATAVAGAIELIVLENPTLGVAGVNWIHPSGIDLLTGPIPDGFRTTARVRLSINARLIWL